MLAHELARILVRGPDVPVVMVLPAVRIEVTAAYWLGHVRYLPADALVALGDVIAIGAPSDMASGSER